MGEQTVKQEEIMTPQEVLHELSRLVQFFEVFKTGQRVIMAMLEAQNKTVALEKANLELVAAVEAGRESLANLQKEYAEAADAWAVKQKEIQEATEKACQEIKEGHRADIEGLEAKIADRKNDLALIEADFARVRDEQNRQLEDIGARTKEVEERLRVAQEALAQIKENL